MLSISHLMCLLDVCANAFLTGDVEVVRQALTSHRVTLDAVLLTLRGRGVRTVWEFCSSTQYVPDIGKKCRSRRELSPMRIVQYFDQLYNLPGQKEGAYGDWCSGKMASDAESSAYVRLHPGACVATVISSFYDSMWPRDGFSSPTVRPSDASLRVLLWEGLFEYLTADECENDVRNRQTQGSKPAFIVRKKPEHFSEEQYEEYHGLHIAWLQNQHRHVCGELHAILAQSLGCFSLDLVNVVLEMAIPVSVSWYRHFVHDNWVHDLANWSYTYHF